MPPTVLEHLASLFETPSQKVERLNKARFLQVNVVKQKKTRLIDMVARLDTDLTALATKLASTNIQDRRDRPVHIQRKICLQNQRALAMSLQTALMSRELTQEMRSIKIELIHSMVESRKQMQQTGRTVMNKAYVQTLCADIEELEGAENEVFDQLDTFHAGLQQKQNTLPGSEQTAEEKELADQEEQDIRVLRNEVLRLPKPPTTIAHTAIEDFLATARAGGDSTS